MHIFGAGGHAKVIIDNLITSGQQVQGVYDENIAVNEVLGQRILGNLAHFKASNASPAIIAIGNNTIRRKIAAELDCEFGLAIHPQSAIAKSVKIGGGTTIMAHATVNADSVIGHHVIVNTNASIDHDCHLADFVHVSPQVGLGGGVVVGEGTHIGLGASVIQGIKIGKWVTIGAGAVIIRDIPDYAVVVGNPGKIVKYNDYNS